MRSPPIFVISGRHVLSHRTRRDANTDLDEELVCDALFTPCDIRSDHLPDELLKILRDRRPSFRS